MGRSARAAAPHAAAPASTGDTGKKPSTPTRACAADSDIACCSIALTASTYFSKPAARVSARSPKVDRICGLMLRCTSGLPRLWISLGGGVVISNHESEVV